MGTAPLASAPRLYVDSLNETFDAQSTRLSALTNRVPGAVLALERVSGEEGVEELRARHKR